MGYKIVYFEKCKDCEHFEKEEYEDVCNECLNEPANLDSRFPVNFKEKDS